MGLISSAGSAKVKGDKSLLRITRSFPVFGKRTLMLYFPNSVGAGFAYVPLANLFDSRVFVKAVPADVSLPSIIVEGVQSSEESQIFEVRSSKKNEPIIVMKTQEDAAEVVRRLSHAICPSHMKWVWAGLGALVLVIMLTPSGTSVPMPAPLSIHTPIAPRLPAPMVTPVPVPAIKPPALQMPSSGASNFPAPANLPSPKPADPNDPFGLKITPESK